MKIPHITKVTIAKAATLTKKTGKFVLTQANNCAIAHNLSPDKVMSTVMFISSLSPQFEARVAKILSTPDVIPVADKISKKVPIAKVTKTVVPKTADKIRLMAKGQVTNPVKLNKKFNDLLLENENSKNPLNNKGRVFLKEAKKHGVDPQVLMAIALHESGRGTSNATKAKRNIGGIMTSKGTLKHYSTIDLCIDQMAETLAYHHRENKINTIKELAYAGKYCGKNEAKEWIKGVMYYLNELQ